MCEGIGELEIEELDQNEVDEEIEGFDSRDKVKHNERNDQLFLEMMMMVVVEQK